MRKLFCSCILCILLAIPAHVYAALDVSYCIPNVPVAVYLIGSLNDTHINWADPFGDLDTVNLKDVASLQLGAVQAASRIRGQQLDPAEVQATNNDGVAHFDSLVPGVYVALTEPVLRNNVRYESVPTIILVPDTSFVELKVETSEVPKGDTSITVRKQWRVPYGTDHPESVTVTLLRNKVPYDTIQLNADTDWQYTWTRLDSEAVWSVTEILIPGDYVASVTECSTGFIITNTSINYVKVKPQTGIDDGTSTTPSKLIVLLSLIPVYYFWKRRIRKHEV